MIRLFFQIFITFSFLVSYLVLTAQASLDACNKHSRPTILSGHTQPVWSVGYYTDNQDLILFSGSADSTIKLWQDQEYSWNATNTFYQEQLSPRTVQLFSPENTVPVFLLGSGGPGGIAALISFLNQTENGWQSEPFAAIPFAGSTTILESLQQTDNSTTFAVAGDLEFKLNLVQELNNKWQVTDFVPQEYPILSCDHWQNSNGTIFATGAADPVVELWQKNAQASWEIIGLLSGHFQGVLALDHVYTQDQGLIVISGSKDTTIKLWQEQQNHTWEAIATLTGHTEQVMVVKHISLPDGNFMVLSGSWDGTIRLWQQKAGTWQTVLKLCVTTPLGGVNALDYVSVAGNAPNTLMIISGHQDNNVRLWLIDLLAL